MVPGLTHEILNPRPPVDHDGGRAMGIAGTSSVMRTKASSIIWIRLASSISETASLKPRVDVFVAVTGPVPGSLGTVMNVRGTESECG